MSSARVVTPSASTSSRAAASPNREIPQTSLSEASVRARPKAIRPAGPVIRIFSPLSTPTSLIFDPNVPLHQNSGMHPTTHPALSAALDALLAALEMGRVGDGRFRAGPDLVRPLGRV